MGNFDFRGAFALFVLLVGVLGWAFIEGVMWVFNHLRIIWE